MGKRPPSGSPNYHHEIWDNDSDFNLFADSYDEALTALRKEPPNNFNLNGMIRSQSIFMHGQKLKILEQIC